MEKSADGGGVIETGSVMTEAEYAAALAEQRRENRIMELAARLARMRGRTVTEVVEALLATKTLERLGYKGDQHLDARQQEAAIAVLEGWVRRAGGDPDADGRR